MTNKQMKKLNSEEMQIKAKETPLHTHHMEIKSANTRCCHGCVTEVTHTLQVGDKLVCLFRVGNSEHVIIKLKAMFSLKHSNCNIQSYLKSD